MLQDDSSAGLEHHHATQTFTRHSKRTRSSSPFSSASCFAVKPKNGKVLGAEFFKIHQIIPLPSTRTARRLPAPRRRCKAVQIPRGQADVSLERRKVKFMTRIWRRRRIFRPMGHTWLTWPCVVLMDVVPSGGGGDGARYVGS